MATLLPPILHHYPNSPFAEKVRLILGYKKMDWLSVHAPDVMPKPDLVALTGGYRKIPVLQVGADIYCDTALIGDVLEHMTPMPSLYPEPGKGLSRIIAQWADQALFWTAMGYSIGGSGIRDVFGPDGDDRARAFAADRKAISTNMVRLRPEDAAGAYKSYLRRMSDMLDEADFLVGAQPTIADFAAYAPLWFTRTRTPSRAKILGLVPSVADWMDRMAAIGHGQSNRLTAEEAISIARDATPKTLLVDSDFQDEHGIPLGTRVRIAGEAFGPEPSEGELMAATRTHYSIRREDPRAGMVHVHFPRIGHALRRVE